MASTVDSRILELWAALQTHVEPRTMSYLMAHKAKDTAERCTDLDAVWRLFRSHLPEPAKEIAVFHEPHHIRDCGSVDCRGWKCTTASGCNECSTLCEDLCWCDGRKLLWMLFPTVATYDISRVYDTTKERQNQLGHGRDLLGFETDASQYHRVHS